MKHLPIQKSSPEKNADQPCNELFIYYLKGRLELHHQKFQSDFLGNWEEEGDSILFFSNPADRQIENLLHCQPDLSYVDSYRMSYDHWLGEKFSTMELGSFRIVPPWEASDVRLDAIADKRLIVLDPGLVFGTGTHPTTRDCLEAIELAADSLNISSVLDLGTGTGLLALAAARLGCDYIVGVDLNLLAARTAARNVQLNRLGSRIVIAQGRAEDMVAYSADLLIANIHYDVMRHLVNSRGFIAKKCFILSGLMRSEVKHIVNLLQRQPVKVIKQWTQDGIWHTIYGKNRTG
jgi:ribosomal protein L11 methyltransferase